jgi:hypothetical protein
MDQDLVTLALSDVIDIMRYEWHRIEDEPPLWYERFAKYYLMLGPSRSILKAYMQHLAIEHPKQYEEYALRPRQSAATGWSDQARKWNWRIRAEAYDKFQYGEAVMKIAEARETLLRAASLAAQALVANLNNPRLAVAAAKEILDRTGIAAESIVHHTQSELNADDLATAAREVKEWQANLLKDPNG